MKCEICQTELAHYCDEVTVDRAGNVIGCIKASCDVDPAEGIQIMAHLDEIAMVVKLVDEAGTLQVEALGGAQPISFEVAPVDILGDSGSLPGVLSFGSMHSSGGTTPLQRSALGRLATVALFSHPCLSTHGGLVMNIIANRPTSDWLGACWEI
ncbi:aminopeptidase [Pseudomonas fluorescens BRIP34879]|nr:aminopeptidase [Pseudomonas fluorescens BRIP34879]